MKTGRGLTDKPGTAPQPLFVCCMGLLWTGRVKRNGRLRRSQDNEGAYLAAVTELNPRGALNSTTGLA